jgi:hypothetical protein
MGIHTCRVKDQKQKAQEKTNQDGSEDISVSDRCSTSPSEKLGYGMSSISLSSDNSEVEQNVNAKQHSSTSESYLSSNSSFLVRHFPKLYFILKSLAQVRVLAFPPWLIYLFIWLLLSMIWILAFKQGSGQLRNTMKGFWISLIG